MNYVMQLKIIIYPQFDDASITISLIIKFLKTTSLIKFFNLW
jgi:hypothetical protein